MSSVSLQMATKKPLGKTYAVIAVVILVLSSLLVYNLTDYVMKEDAAVQNAQQHVMESTKDAAAKMDSNFAKLQQIADQQVREVETHHYSQQELQDKVYAVMEENPEAFGFLVAYKPYKYGADTKLFAPYSDRKDGAIRRMQIEDIYDYTQENTSGLYWYLQPLGQGAGWTEPYFGSASSSLLSVYSVPFYGTDPETGSREILGVVSIVYSLDDIENFTRALDFGGRGYAYLLSKEGTYISHPTKENVLEQRKFGDTADGIDQDVAAQLLADNSKLYESTNNLTGQASWVLHQAVPSTGYTLGAVFIKDAMINDKDFTRHKLIMISILAVLILALLSVFLTRGSYSTEKRLWGISLFISALLVVEISMVWFLSTKYNTYSDNELVIVTDDASVQNFVNEKYDKPASELAGNPILIPTGVFIQSLEFENANNVKLTGYIWQKYSKDIPDTVSRGIVLPEAVSSSVEEAYVRDEPDGQTIGWHFDATLRQSFDYSKYPLDNKDVWIRLWPQDFDKNVILVPDFASYKLTNPDYLPGVDSNIILSGWDINQSFFCYYIDNSYNTNFGIQGYSGQDKFPELAYMAIISRKFMNPFISYLLPFVVMAFMLFGTLALIYIIESKAEKFDFSAAGVLAACTGLFFSVVLTHTALRDSITGNGILYLEYFYFVLYAAIVLVIVDAFLVAFNSKSWFIKYKDNIIPKILYWPSMLAVILAITLHIFY